MSITVNIYYKGKGENANLFAEEMENSGIADKIRAENGNLMYEYFYPKNDSETVLLIDSWENQESIDLHHNTPMMNDIIRLREKYDLHMTVKRFISDDIIPQSDEEFIRQ